MRRLLQSTAMPTALLLIAPLAFAQSPIHSRPQSARSAAPAPAGVQLPVIGGGTLGKLTKWTGFNSNNSVLGDANIFEDKFGNVGIGTTTPTSPLTVQGMIETTLGGFKFPDGTVQTTAGLSAVFRDTTLKDDGTQSSPLGVAVPLKLRGGQ